MSTMVLPMASPKSLKRNFDEITTHEGFPVKDEPQPSSLSSTMPSSTVHPQLAPSTSNLNQAPPPDPSKKPKLSFADKEAQRVEKEIKDNQRAEDRAKKEQEKAAREEERLKKAEEREQEKAQREQEKAQREKEKAAREEERLKKAEEKKLKEDERRKVKEEKDRIREEEKQKKTEEKQKKERSQMRLNAFFVQPTDRSPTLSPRATPSGSRRGSLADVKVEDLGLRSRSVSVPPVQQQSDFQRVFPEFYLHPHVTLASNTNFSRDESALSHAREKLDNSLFVKPEPCVLEHPMVSFSDKLQLPPRKRQRRLPAAISVKSVIAQMDGAAQNPIDLTESSKPKTDPAETLKQIPVKFIKFYQDVRPPYKGTYTKITCLKQTKRLARNPFLKYRPDTDYDYDSEAEWEDPGEGEDLHSEDEDEPEDDDEDDMQEFLDNEEAQDRRRPLLGNMEPTCTGICWADAEDGPDLSQFQIDMLTETPSFPIDPYNPSYWPKPPPPAPRFAPPKSAPPLTIATHPAIAFPSSNTLRSIFPDIGKDSAHPKTLIPLDLLPEFKASIQGSDMTKVVLVDLLKRRFPKHSKDVLKDSLDAVAERTGTHLKTKRWVLREGV